MLFLPNIGVALILTVVKQINGQVEMIIMSTRSDWF